MYLVFLGLLKVLEYVVVSSEGVILGDGYRGCFVFGFIGVIVVSIFMCVFWLIG